MVTSFCAKTSFWCSCFLFGSFSDPQSSIGPLDLSSRRATLSAVQARSGVGSPPQLLLPASYLPLRLQGRVDPPSGQAQRRAAHHRRDSSTVASRPRRWPRAPRAQLPRSPSGLHHAGLRRVRNSSENPRHRVVREYAAPTATRASSSS
uniref:Uncharacterized protein n=1 Tax=Aegilops tauschii subsp. strangulata TaxID=200361 RepID=A0A453H850_AEGTS